LEYRQGGTNAALDVCLKMIIKSIFSERGETTVLKWTLPETMEFCCRHGWDI